MLELTKTRCAICGAGPLTRPYSEEWRGDSYFQAYCGPCRLYQTTGSYAAISPEYDTLEHADVTDEYVSLQTTRKLGAFKQWHDLVTRFSNGEARGRLLDVGCGLGGFLDTARDLGFETFGFDASKVHIEQARSRHSNVGNHVSLDQYIETLPPGTAFDFVTMWDVLEHIRNPLEFLPEIGKHIAPGGLMFVSVPGGGMTLPKRLVGRLRGRVTQLYPWEHVFYHSPKSLRTIFERSGFEVLKIGGVVVYPRPNGPIEAVRRVVTGVLAETPLALQLYCLARPVNRSIDP